MIFGIEGGSNGFCEGFDILKESGMVFNIEFEFFVSEVELLCGMDVGGFEWGRD